MKRDTVDILLDLAPLILRAMDLVELLFRGLIGMSEAKCELVVDRVIADPQWPGFGNGLYTSELRAAIDRGVLWNNAVGWKFVNEFDEHFEKRVPA